MPDCQNSMSSSADRTDADDLCRLKRSLCTGPADHLDDASQERLDRLLSSPQWKETVDVVLHFIRTGRAAKRKPLIAALAFSTCCSTADPKVVTKIRQAVYGSLSDVCQTPSDLFQLFQYEAEFSKRRVKIGRCKRTAIGKWYNGKSPRDLAYLVTKYKRRCGWSHRDVLRVAHVKPCNSGTLNLLSGLDISVSHCFSCI
jgi:TROVE domain